VMEMDDRTREARSGETLAKGLLVACGETV
jgi:hypothetical protein